MANAAIGVGAGTVFNGRALAIGGAIALNSNQVYSAPPVVTIAGGSSADVNTSSPTISGTTDVEAPGVVTVTIAGQTLTATPSGGAWSVPAGMLANGTYPVTAVGRRRGGKHWQRHPAAHDRHGAASADDRRRPNGYDQ